MSSSPDSPASPAPGTPARVRHVVKPAVGPRLRILMWFVFALIAVLGANSAYLGAVTFMSWSQGRTYENWFYMLMFAGHLVLGLLLVLPFMAFIGIHLLNTRMRKNKRAIRVGYALLVASIVVLVSGVLLMRIDLGGKGASALVIKDAATRSIGP